MENICFTLKFICQWFILSASVSPGGHDYLYSLFFLRFGQEGALHQSVPFLLRCPQCLTVVMLFSLCISILFIAWMPMKGSNHFFDKHISILFKKIFPISEAFLHEQWNIILSTSHLLPPPLQPASSVYQTPPKQALSQHHILFIVVVISLFCFSLFW